MKYCIVVPTYNNVKTLPTVLRELAALPYDLMVVNDGATDGTQACIEALEVKFEAKGRCLYVVSYTPNRGKGYALRQALKVLHSKGYDYALSIDADGQHDAADIAGFIHILQQHPTALMVGSRGMKHENMPRKNTFANRFSNFWFAVQTAQHLPDTQSGFRAYPLKRLGKMRFFTRRYEWEIEVLVRAAWSGIPLRAQPISVYYPPKEERVSHFRPGRDFLRISLLNTVLCLGALLYFYPLLLIKSIIAVFRRPKTSAASC